MMKVLKILIILTSHSQLGETGLKTGFWLEEYAAPYYVFFDTGVEITVASPAGGQPPLDPKSDEPGFQTDATRRFKADSAAQKVLANTLKLSDVTAADYDAVMYPGGHGPLWDLTTDTNSIALIEAFFAAGKPVGAVCHAPAVLLHAKAANGEPLVKGKKVTGFSNSEERAVQLTQIVPLLVEDELCSQGGIYSSGADWGPYVLTDGLLVTGQNPASSEPAAQALLVLLKK